MNDVEAVMRLGPVIPVLVVDDAAHAVGIAEALVAGGLPALEVTLRTPAALDVIRAMATVPGATVGAGTVLNERDLDAALEAGARSSSSAPASPSRWRAPRSHRAYRSCRVSPTPPTSCAGSTSG